MVPRCGRVALFKGILSVTDCGYKMSETKLICPLQMGDASEGLFESLEREDKRGSQFSVEESETRSVLHVVAF